MATVSASRRGASSSTTSSNVIVKSGAPNWPKMVSYKAPESTTPSSSTSSSAYSNTQNALKTVAKSQSESEPVTTALALTTSKVGIRKQQQQMLQQMQPSISKVAVPSIYTSAKADPLNIERIENRNNSNIQQNYLNNNTTYLASPRSRRREGCDGNMAPVEDAPSKPAVQTSLPTHYITTSSNNRNININSNSNMAQAGAEAKLVRQCHKCQVLFVSSHACG